MEDEEQQQWEASLFEYGKPFWGDCLQTERLEYRLTLLALREANEQSLKRPLWLEPVTHGEKPGKVAGRLRRGWN